MNKSSGVPFVLCSTCKQPIPEEKVLRSLSSKKSLPTFCSKKCRAYIPNPYALRDPRNQKEEDELNRIIKEGKASINTVVKRNTPTDDSPEAERMLRAKLDSNSEGYWSRLGKDVLEHKYTEALRVKGITDYLYDI